MGIYKRGRVWWMSFVCKGRHYRKSTETEDRKLAQRILDKAKGEVAEGKWFERLPGEDKTFREMIERFETEYISQLASYRAAKSYITQLKNFFGDCLVSEVTPSLINEFKLKRKAQGVKPATIRRQFDLLKRAFNIAMKEWEWCSSNPVTRVSLDRANNARDRRLTIDEEEKLVQVCPQWLKEIVVFALNTGCRLSEIRFLTWKGADLFRKTITLFQTKNGERRTIPMNQTVFELLKAKSKVRLINSDFVFPTSHGTAIRDNNIERAFRAALKKAKVADFRFHDLRHSAATRMVQNGVDLYKVQLILGHKGPQMAQRYAHHYPESLRSAVDILDKRVTNLSQLGGPAKQPSCNILNSQQVGQ